MMGLLASPGAPFELIPPFMKSLGSVFLFCLLFLSVQSARAMHTVFEEGVDGYAGTADNTIYADAVTHTAGGHHYLYAGNTKTSNPRRTLIRFDLGAIPHGATITSVQLQFVVQRRAAQAFNETHTLHRLTRDWGEGNVDPQVLNPETDGGDGAPAQPGDATWLDNHFQESQWDSPGGDFIAAPSASAVMPSPGARGTFSGAGMIADLQGWIDNPATNFGWVMRGNEIDPQRAYRFHSSEGLVGSRPRLIIDFDPPKLGPVPPKVSDPGDIIIGDLENPLAPGLATAANTFVYPDAFNLNNIAFDDATAKDQIKWSFTGGQGRILINGVAPLDESLFGVNEDDPTSPRAESRIDLNDGDPAALDGDPFTVTFRNAALSPINGPNIDPGATGILPDQTIVVTFFASDCTTFASRSITVYTAKGSSDSLSVGAANFILSDDFRATGSGTGWSGGFVPGFGGTTSVGANGLCMTVPKLGANLVLWVSPERYFELADNRVYRVRVSLTTDQTDPDAIPLFLFTYDNFNSSGVGNNYGGFAWILDVDGGAQGIGREQGRAIYEFWLAPNSLTTPQWRAAAFTPEADDSNDPRIIFQVNDTSASLLADNDSGTICIGGIQIDSIAREDLLADSMAYNPPISSSTHAAGVNFGAGSAVINEALHSVVGQLGTAGDNRLSLVPFDPTQPTLNAQLFPVVWEAETLYRIRTRVRAVDSETDPVDAVFTAIDVTNSELGVQTFTTRGAPGDWTDRAASPKLGSAEYESYFFGHNATASLTPDANRLRPLAFFFNTDFLGGSGTGGDAFIVESLALDKLISPP